MRRLFVNLLIIVGAFAAALFFMPMRMAIEMAGLDDEKFSAKQITGSIWNGHIGGAKIGPLELGDLDAAMQFWPLLTGTAKLDLSRGTSEGQNSLSATIGKSGEVLLVENATTSINIGRQLAPLPTSDIDFEGVNISFANGRCQSASGKVRVSLDANIPGLDLQQGLLGNAECKDGALILPLTSGSGMEKLTLKLEASGRYTARLFLKGGNSAWTLLLPTLGFRKTPEGYAINIDGNLKN